MEIEICKPTPEQAELQELFAEVPSKESIERATYLLNNYSKDSEADIICLALAIDRRLKETAQKIEDLKNKKLDPKQPICTKCVNNLTYHDGWNCMCEEKDFDRSCWVNFGHADAWEKCADRLFVYAMETLSTANSMALYEAAKEDVLVYNRLKNVQI
jgi:hypothetical protein